MLSVAKEHFSKDERDFTLSEMLITIIIMSVVLMALYNIFDMSIKTFSYGNNKVEAVESARVGMEKMEREIRQASQFNAASSQTHLFFTTPTPTTTTPLAVSAASYTFPQLTFGNDLNAVGATGYGVIECGSPCEYITYKLTDSAGTGPCTAPAAGAAAKCTLRRVNTSNSADPGDPVVENVAYNGLSFKLLKSNGTSPANEGEVGMVLVSLNIEVKQGVSKKVTQTLSTATDLRNR